MASLKRKGDLAEMKVAVDLLDVILIRCRSHSLTKGKIRQTKRYTAETIDWIAVYDARQIAATTAPPASLEMVDAS